ncbi:MAG: PASTA domain-containing protein [Phycisphaerae bacterium]|nr:PASTA domain-containing protein [Phycisphaerae bacterium]
MRTTRAAAFVVGVCLLCSGGPARADVVTWSYEGTVTSLTDPSNELDSSVAVGATFTVVVSYNTTPQSSGARSHQVAYNYTKEVPDGMSMSVTVGDYTFTSHKPPGEDRIRISNDLGIAPARDSFVVEADHASSARLPGWDGCMDLELSTVRLSAITTLDLPQTAPDLDEFPVRRLAILFTADASLVIMGRVGAVVKLYEVPDVVGMTIEEAEALINAAELNLGYIYGDSAEPRGTVISQEQEPGTVLWPEATVKLVVSNGSRARARGGLVAYWKLDETGGTIASDSVGDHDGTVKGNPVWLPEGGMLDGALQLDGDADYVEIGNHADFDLTEQMTVSAWIQVDTFDRQWHAIVTKGDSAWRLHRYRGYNTIGFHYTRPGTTYAAANGVRSVNDGQWHHVAGTFDGSTICLYIDGTLDAFSATSGPMATNSYPVMIGENAQTRGRYFKGLMDEVRIYNVALSESSVVKAMQGIVESATPPMAQWKLDETSGTIASDSVGDHDGTVKGNPVWLPEGGMLDGALQLDGDGDYVEIGDHADFDLTEQMTVSAWIQVDTFDRQWHAIVTKGDSAWRLHRYRAYDTIGFHYTRPGTTYAAANGVRSINDGEWHHVAGTFDGSTICLYIDGTLDAFSPTSGPMATNSYPVLIGENAEQRSRYWHGLIDDVRLYDVALDAQGIQECMLGQAPSGTGASP